ncbi:MAG: folate-binding protein [Rhizobiales bacterium]|nr:folate-binding protein [Hyphomicrobiales bacterium]
MPAERKWTLLDDRAMVRVSGPDAAGFLNGLVTNAVDGLEEFMTIRFAGLLTPQGKVLFDFLVWKWDREFYLDCPRPLVGDLVKRLGFYRLRAKVEIADASDQLAVAAIWSEEGDLGPPASLPDDVMAFRDPRLETLGRRVAAHPDTLATAGVGLAERIAGSSALLAEARLADYHHHRVLQGVPELTHDYAPNEVYPHDVDYDLLGGIDFKKGCYVGQEVVSRMRHKATIRTRTVAVEARPNGAPLPPAGTKIRAGSVAIGTLGSSSRGLAIATLRLDRLARARTAGETMTAGDVAIDVRAVPWLAGELEAVAATSGPGDCGDAS